MELQTLHLIEPVDGIAEVRLIRHDGLPNAFSELVIDDLDEVTQRLHEITPGLRGVIVTSTGRDWMGSLPVNECRRIQSMREDQARNFSLKGMRALNYFQELEVPTVAVLTGNTFGCGLDLALAMDLRIATPHVMLGFCEKELGFMPAMMGPWRMAGIAGLAHAFEWAHTGQAYPASAARSLGLITEIAPGDLRELASNLIAALSEGKSHPELRKNLINRPPKEGPANEQPPEVAEQARFARQALSCNFQDVNMPAPNEVISALEEAVCLKRDRVMESWSARFGRVARTTATDAILTLVPAFDAAFALAAKVQKTVPTLAPIGLVGGGVIAGSIASDLALSVQVVSLATQPERIKAARSEFESALQRRLQRRQIGSESFTQASHRFGEAGQPCALDECGAVIDVRIATGAPKPLGRSYWFGDMPDHAIFSGSTMLAKTCGITFMPPEWKSRLALVTVGEKRDPPAVHVALALGHRMGMRAIPVKPTPAGLVHRIFFAGVMGFLDLLHHGESYATADLLLRREGWPLGIGQMLDAMGAEEVRYRMGLLRDAYPDRFVTLYTTAIESLASRNRSFYQPNNMIDPVSFAMIKSNQVGTDIKYTNSQVASHIINPMIFEAIRCLDEGIAPNPGVINLVSILSNIFPLHRGGPLKMMEIIGTQSMGQWANDNPNLGGMVKPPESFRVHYRQRTVYR